MELNVIVGWLGHTSPETTHRYAEIGMRTKIAAVETCLQQVVGKDGEAAADSWDKTPELLDYLNSL